MAVTVGAAAVAPVMARVSVRAPVTEEPEVTVDETEVGEFVFAVGLVPTMVAAERLTAVLAVIELAAVVTPATAPVSVLAAVAEVAVLVVPETAPTSSLLAVMALVGLTAEATNAMS